MKSDLYVIKVRAPIYQAAQKLEAGYPGESLIAVSEWLMDQFAHAGERNKARLWRDVWAFFMERDAVADTETLAIVTS